MPIEVRELVIKAAVADDGNGATQSNTSSNNSVGQTEEIIKTCVERILGILKDKNER